ncbi:MAG: flagellar biosynthetic protein FliQ [Alphaproteobacteria bacterium]|nr:MAG: flagellar biosynthetic protein FliQ [Alphaproteobacteria bacterium]
MQAVDAYEVIRLTINTILLSCGPVLAGALVVGLVIAFFQALTQIQEMTLTFVPKIVAIFFLLTLTLPFMFQSLSRLAERVFDLVIAGGI